MAETYGFLRRGGEKKKNCDMRTDVRTLLLSIESGSGYQNSASIIPPPIADPVGHMS